jgi:hypothetical protein
MNDTVTEGLPAAKLGCHPLKIDLPQIERHQARGCHDLCELGIAERDRTHVAGSGGCSSCALVVRKGNLPMPALGQPDDALYRPAFHIPNRPGSFANHATSSLHENRTEVFAGDAHGQLGGDG